MGRFCIAFNIGKGLKIDEINKDNVKEIKIKDKHGELPDLIVTDENVARDYVNYFNNPINIVDDFERISFSIMHDVYKMNGLSGQLIKPKEVFKYYDEELEEDVYEVPLRERLFYEGYLNEIHEKERIIKNKFDKLKKLIFE